MVHSKPCSTLYRLGEASHGDLIFRLNSRTKSRECRLLLSNARLHLHRWDSLVNSKGSHVCLGQRFDHGHTHDTVQRTAGFIAWLPLRYTVVFRSHNRLLNNSLKIG